jgi:hypothetical protein
MKYFSKNKVFAVVAALFISMLLFSACDGSSVPNKGESKQVSDQQNIYTNDQQVPTFNWSLKRQLLIDYYTATTEKVSYTYSYVYNPYKGVIMWSCPSVGYPIPGGTQLTNPTQLQEGDSHGSSSGYWGGTVNQMEPDGTYSPSNAAATIVMCLNDDGTVSPQYVEDNVFTSTYPMTVDENGTMVRADSSKSTINFSTQKKLTTTKK